MEVDISHAGPRIDWGYVDVDRNVPPKMSCGKKAPSPGIVGPGGSVEHPVKTSSVA